MKSFNELFLELTQKTQNSAADSNSVRLVEAGVHAIGKKIVEEAAEVWMASEFETKERAAEEISQLIYHLQVMMIAKGISIQDLESYL
jgi:phosphoribosyl-ATP pyrophosphohydrolase